MALKLDFKKLKNWKNTQKLKKIALTIIASQLNECEIEELKDLFKELDGDGNGVLSIEEIKTGLKKSKKKIVTKEVLKTFESIDTDQSGKIDYTEFLAVCMDKNVYLKEEKLYGAFKLFDKDNDGCISCDELKEVLG